MGRPKGIDLSARNYRNLSAAMDEVLNPRESLARGKEKDGSSLNMSEEEAREFRRTYKQAWRARMGARQVSCDLGIEGAAAMLYLKAQWGFKSTQETVNVALRFMATETRKGLQKFDLGVPDDPT